MQTRQDIAVGSFDGFGLACQTGLASSMPRAHRHDEIELNLVTHGTMTYLVGGASVTLAAGDLALFWAAMPHQVVALAPDTYLSWLTVPLATFLRWSLPASFSRAVLHGFVVHHEGETAVVWDRSLLDRWQNDLAAGDDELRRVALLEIEARLHRLARTEPAVEQPVREFPSSGLAHAARMAHYLAERYVAPVTVRDVAEAVGLHPHYAMQLFRAAFGLSIHGYLTRQRIAHAQRLLVTTDLPVLEIALEAGFGSVSRFYAAFRHAGNQTPKAYRARVRAPV
ncbi:MAG: helix-turn-helix domain-containing protein [Thermomicrobiales bacterium]